MDLIGNVLNVVTKDKCKDQTNVKYPQLKGSLCQIYDQKLNILFINMFFLEDNPSEQ